MGREPSLSISKKFCGAHTGIVGAYLALPNKILLMGYTNEEEILPTLCHELIHAVQKNQYGFCGYLFRKTFFRKSLEEEADKVTEFVEKYIRKG